MTVSVLPDYKEGQPLAVYVLLGRTTRAVELDPHKFEVHYGTSAVAHRPSTVTMKEAGPNFLKSIRYVLPRPASSDEIAVVFLSGFIKLDGKQVEVAPFRFHKVTKLDVYYGSINC